jgi:hypothetical protein
LQSGANTVYAGFAQTLGKRIGDGTAAAETATQQPGGIHQTGGFHKGQTGASRQFKALPGLEKTDTLASLVEQLRIRPAVTFDLLINSIGSIMRRTKGALSNTGKL